MTSPAIRTTGLGRDFGTVRALEDVTLEVPRGIIFGFLGPNGSGKTTTIRLLLGLLDPTRGMAEVLGYDTRSNAAAIRQRSGALLEHNGLYERLSAIDNLDFYGRIWGLSAADRRARAQELLTRLDLWDRRDQVVASWSRGMKQQLAIARALLHRPEVVFLDEPTAGLDPVAALALRDYLTQLSVSEGVTIFLTTHNLAEAERICALVGVVRDGRLLAVAPPAQLGGTHEVARVEITGSGLSDGMMAMLRNRPGVVAVRAEGRVLSVELRSAGEVPSLLGALIGAGFQLEAVRNGAGSLEEAFHTLVEVP